MILCDTLSNLDTTKRTAANCNDTIAVWKVARQGLASQITQDLCSLRIQRQLPFTQATKRREKLMVRLQSSLYHFAQYDARHMDTKRRQRNVLAL